MNTLICVLVACFAVAASLITDKCPPRGSLRCYCRAQPQGSKVFCNSIESLEALQGRIKPLENYAIDYLELKYVSSALPADLFQGLHIKSLSVFDFDVSAESSFLPELGLENSLEKLEFDFVRQGNNSIANFKLDHYQSLKEIIIDDTLISEVGNDWFANGPKSLRELELRRNQLQRLGDRAFSSLTNLRELRIRDNQLKEISRSVLPSPATNLQKLNLNRNKISNIPKDFFSEMPSLKYVYLSDNGIQSLPEDTWSPILSNLEEVWIGFHVKCDQDIRWICDEKNLDDVYAYCDGNKHLKTYCMQS